MAGLRTTKVKDQERRGRKHHGGDARCVCLDSDGKATRVVVNATTLSRPFLTGFSFNLVLKGGRHLARYDAPHVDFWRD